MQQRRLSTLKLPDIGNSGSPTRFVLRRQSQICPLSRHASPLWKWKHTSKAKDIITALVATWKKLGRLRVHLQTHSMHFESGLRQSYSTLFVRRGHCWSLLRLEREKLSQPTALLLPAVACPAGHRVVGPTSKLHPEQTRLRLHLNYLLGTRYVPLRGKQVKSAALAHKFDAVFIQRQRQNQWMERLRPILHPRQISGIKSGHEVPDARRPQRSPNQNSEA